MQRSCSWETAIAKYPGFPVETTIFGLIPPSTLTPSRAIACLEGDRLTLERAGTSWESREARIPKGFHPSVIAIDGPLLPLGTDQIIRRHVESVFIRAPFHNRCRPGLSHHGVGLQLRQASSDACVQFGGFIAPSVLANGDSGGREGPIVEAFPNAFLGVLMPEVELLAAPKFKRGRRFDWSYDKMVTTGRQWNHCCQNAWIYRMKFGSDYVHRPIMN
jgi:hypothetical protein